MSAAVGYIRVSTVGQATDGVSLETQENKIRMYADLNDLDLVDVFVDAGLSGKSIAGRPGIQSVLELVRTKKIEHVIIFKLDRLARNLKEACEVSDLMQKRGVALHSISEKIDTGSATGKLFYHIISAMAEWERGIISERTVAALQTKKAKSERISGRSPYGYRFENGLVVEDASEQEVISIILRLTSEGHSITNIIAFLAHNGYTNRSGKAFGRAEVWKIQKQAA